MRPTPITARLASSAIEDTGPLTRKRMETIDDENDRRVY